MTSNNDMMFIVFSSIHNAIKAEKLLQEQGKAQVESRPLPPRISSQCGHGLLVGKEQLSECQELLQKEGIEWEKVVKL